MSSKPQSLEEANQQVRDRDECQHCGGEVPEEDYKWKFAAAGGALAGPFCGMSCQFGWLM